MIKVTPIILDKLRMDLGLISRTNSIYFDINDLLNNMV